MTETGKPVIVLKFGGSSLKDRECIEKVLDIIVSRVEKGFSVVTVVSAQGKTTENLLAYVRDFAPNGNPRETDMLLTTGERMSAAIVAMALETRGLPAVSLSGSQAGIITDNNHTNARIIEVRPSRVFSLLNEGRIVIVGGFQGVSFDKEITTLGRGGSDTTAVALAAALNADCEIFSDVDGVYSADPAIIPEAKKLDWLSYAVMQELSEAGAKVLHSRAVEFAKVRNIKIHCKSTFSPNEPGSVIAGFEMVGKIRKSAVAYEKNVTMIRVFDTSEGGEHISDVLDFFREKGVAVKQISFSRDSNGRLYGSFILSRKENYAYDSFIAELSARFAGAIEVFEELSTVSVVGDGIMDKPDALLETLDLMKKSQIELFGFHTSSFRISLLVKLADFEKSLKLLHERFSAEDSAI